MTNQTPADQTPDSVREQLLDALDFAYCQGIGYSTPEELLATYETARWGALIEEADRLRRAGAALHAQAEEVDERVDALRQAAAPAADQTALRDRIAAAIWERQNPGRRWEDCEYRWRADAEEDADEVLAVLPAPTDTAAVRAATLRWAADRIDNEELPDDYVDMFDNGARWAARLLRRLADETQDTEPAASFTPPARYRRDDGVDCCVHAVPVGPGSCPACRELADEQPPAVRPDGPADRNSP